MEIQRFYTKDTWNQIQKETMVESRKNGVTMCTSLDILNILKYRSNTLAFTDILCVTADDTSETETETETTVTAIYSKLGR